MNFHAAFLVIKIGGHEHFFTKSIRYHSYFTPFEHGVIPLLSQF